MSIVWTLIASFLYAEIVVVLLFVLPIVSPSRWQSFFRSRFLQTINRQAQMYFYLLFGVLLLFLLDAIREMRKYSNIDHNAERQDIGMQHSMRMFRAQRNFYISGFAIFLILVIRRLVILISEQATMATESETIRRQAQSATSAARTLLSHQKQQETENRKDDDRNRGLEDRKSIAMIEELRAKLTQVKAQVERERAEKATLKTQADTLNGEYDKLTEEYAKLQRRMVETLQHRKQE